jgi:two-component system, OmpR family, alkaline phosphatase synthesis response regulator PhoP
MTLSKILIVEDEKHLAEGLRFNLEAEGYEVELVMDGGAALELLLAQNKQFDAVVLDVMLPEVNGFIVAQTMREAENFIPILMLTARNHPEDVLRGFEVGADDYVPKPFELAIFLARLKGLLRRRDWIQREKAVGESASSLSDVYYVNGRAIDLENLQIKDGIEITQLTLMEAKLLRYLIQNSETPVSRKTILEEVWDLHEDTDTRAIDNFIVRLRRYLEDEPNNPKILQTVRGIGYRFVRE